MRWLFLIFALACGDDSAVDAGLDSSTRDTMPDTSSDTASDVTADTMADASAVDSSMDAGSMDAPRPDAPSCSVVAETATRPLMFGGADREFVVHVPTSASGDNALVIDLHGFTESPDRQDGRSDMRAKADAEGFVVVQPRGQGTSWNAGACCGSASGDDVAFLRAIVDEIAAETCIDRTRVYVTGMSNGGFLAHRVACEASDFVAAIAPVAGVLGIDEADCTPTRPVPVMHFHGTADIIVPYGGSVFLSYPSVDDTIAFWRSLNECEADSTITYDEGNTECATWACGGGTATTLCTTSGFGHNWPDGGSNIDATDAMWTFFQRHSL